jgi:hypothetical protein
MPTKSLLPSDLGRHSRLRVFHLPGSLTAQELAAELDKYGRVRTYWPSASRRWMFMLKKDGKYWVEHQDGTVAAADFDGIAYAITRGRIYVFTNYWHFYAYCLKSRIPVD